MLAGSIPWLRRTFTFLPNTSLFEASNMIFPICLSTFFNYCAHIISIHTADNDPEKQLFYHFLTLEFNLKGKIFNKWLGQTCGSVDILKRQTGGFNTHPFGSA